MKMSASRNPGQPAWVYAGDLAAAAAQFREAIEHAGLIPPQDINPDGHLHRFSSGGRKGDDAGWYVFHGDGIPAGTFGCWRNDVRKNWRADIGRPLTQKEQAAYRASLKAILAEREADQARRRDEAATKAGALWGAAKPANTNHPYLQRKLLAAPASLRELSIEDVESILGYKPWANDETLRGRILIVPIKTNDHLVTAELIDEAGRKSSVAGGSKRWGFWAAQQMPAGDGFGVILLVGEGAATVLSAHAATGHPAVAALSCSNLVYVAQILRERYPRATLIILADRGRGETDARKAAQGAGALLAVPHFPDGSEIGGKPPSDFNDLHVLHGPDAVRNCIEAASSTGGHSIVVRRASEVQPKPVRWLWPGRIARGKVSLLVGHPGLGKSQVGASIAALVSTGGTWPVDQTSCERGSVIILSAEDDPEDTIRPRLEAVGADLEQIYFLEAVMVPTGTDGRQVRRSFSLEADLPRLEALLKTIGDVKLVSIDPITAYLGHVDSHRNAEVRALLAPLTELAARYGVAVIGVSHLNKTEGQEAVTRVSGSVGFVAAARAAFLVTKDKGNPLRRLLLPIKNNLGNDQTGLAFTIEGVTVPSPDGAIDTSRVLWEADALTITADQALASSVEQSRSARVEAEQFLVTTLSNGPVLSKEIEQQAKAAGVSIATLRRAKESLGVGAFRDTFGGNGGWKWRLPAKALIEPKGAHISGMSTFDESEQLCPQWGAAEDFEVF